VNGSEHAASVARGRVLMLLSMALFAANALFVRLLGTHFGVNSWVLATVRFATGVALVLAPWVPGGRLEMRAVLFDRLLLTRGIVGGAAVWAFYHTIPPLGVGRATFINITYVLWGALLAALVLKERLRAQVAWGLAFGVAGVALLCGVSLRGWSPTGADALALAGAIGSGVVIVAIRKAHDRVSTKSIFAAQCVWGLVVTCVPAVRGWETPTPLVMMLLIASGVLVAGGQLTMTAAYRSLPVGEGSLLQTLGPVLIAVGGMVLFAETYTVLQGLGAALTLGGCLLASVSRPRLAAGLPSWLQRSRPPKAGVE
jgi:drug/metabolite transporter (DMT)-like permease